jgi:hypothetical protein
MSVRRYNKKELFELATAIADGEASESEQEAFLEAAESDLSLKIALEREKKIKHLINIRCTRAKAPDHLGKKIEAIITANRHAGDFPASGDFGMNMNMNESGISDGGTSVPVAAPRRISNIQLFSMAAVLILALMLFNFQIRPYTAPQNLELLVYKHFVNHGGTLLPVSFNAENTLHAAEILNQDYNINLIVPELAGATFSGVVYSEFASNYHTPLLEYTVEDDDHIYVFAFCLDSLKRYGILERDGQAVHNISGINDVYIKEIEDRHVVSWKWHDVWYSAISNHDGQTIVSMLPKH